MTELTIGTPDMDAAIKAFNEASGNTEEIETTYPPSNEVVLPGGYVSNDGTLHKVAEIRELNGADEEALAKAGSPNKALNVALQRGLVSLGSEPVSPNMLDGLLIGDRDAILLGIRAATFGKDTKINFTCTTCMSEQTTTIDITSDIETVELEDPVQDRFFSVNAKAGEVLLTLPNGITQKKMLDSDNKTNAELFTDVLSGCIISVNDVPSMGKSTALNLGMADRELLIAEIVERTPGPRLGEVNKACEACGSDVTLSLSLASLFHL